MPKAYVDNRRPTWPSRLLKKAASELEITDNRAHRRSLDHIGGDWLMVAGGKASIGPAETAEKA
jgi:hypothetical protein